MTDDKTPKTVSKTTKRLAKSEPKKQKLSFSFEESEQPLNSHNMHESMRQTMGIPLSKSAENLKKSIKAQTIDKEVEGKYDKSKIVFASNSYSTNPDNTLQKGYTRLSDSELRQICLTDPYISAIITTRCSQGGTTGQESDSKFDKGMRIREVKPLNPDDFEDSAQYKKSCELREKQIAKIRKWVLHCGTTDKDIVNYAFQDADPMFKWCSLKEFIEAQVRNILTFGRCGTQVFRNSEGVPVMFRPVPIETISPVEQGESLHIGTNEETAESSVEDLKEYNKMTPDERPAAFVQKINGQNVNFFTEDDLHVWYYQKQALFDLAGYPLAPVEMAIYMAFIHQQTLGYLRNQFIKGLATKGILVFESTNPNVQISDADLEDFKQQFHNFVTRTDNSAVTPVIGGPVKVNWVPLSASPKDMEFLQVEEHVIRALCSAFQISPMEMGYGHLSLPQGGLSQGNRQEDVIKGEERGLRMLLDVVFEGIKKILCENFPEAEDNFLLTYVGIGEDTKDAVLQRQQAELNTTATLSSLYADSEKNETIPFGGNVPLAQSFHASVVSKMTYGEFREYFFGEEGARKRPEYDFIIDPNLNAAYQQLKVQPIQMQQEGAKLQIEGQEQQMQAMQAQMQQGQQQAQEGGQPPQQGQPPQEEQAPEKMEESEGNKIRVSLRDKYKSLKHPELLEKSIKSYFQEWNNSHKDQI